MFTNHVKYTLTGRLGDDEVHLVFKSQDLAKTRGCCLIRVGYKDVAVWTVEVKDIIKL